MYEIFNKCDELILLSEGKIVYNGGAKNAVSYFGDLGYELPMYMNPADFLVDIIQGVIKPTQGQNKDITPDLR